MTEERSTLVLVDRAGHALYYLAGRPLSRGDIVDLCFAGGWVTGMYSWTGALEDRPCFHYSIELVRSGEVFRGMLEIPEGAVLRR